MRLLSFPTADKTCSSVYLCTLQQNRELQRVDMVMPQNQTGAIIYGSDLLVVGRICFQWCCSMKFLLAVIGIAFCKQNTALVSEMHLVLMFLRPSTVLLLTSLEVII